MVETRSDAEAKRKVWEMIKDIGTTMMVRIRELWIPMLLFLALPFRLVPQRQGSFRVIRGRQEVDGSVWKNRHFRLLLRKRTRLVGIVSDLGLLMVELFALAKSFFWLILIRSSLR